MFNEEKNNVFKSNSMKIPPKEHTTTQHVFVYDLFIRFQSRFGISELTGENDRRSSATKWNALRDFCRYEPIN